MGKNFLVDPDEIFLDSHNLENFDRQQFEGRIEKPIPKRTMLFLAGAFAVVVLVFGSRLVYLQIINGQSYFNRSQNNILEKAILFTDRGIIYDRNKVPLVWNNKPDATSLATRVYLSPGFSHLVGYVSYPTADKSGNYWQDDFIGKAGLEEEYNDTLKGQNGSKIIETDALGKVYSENVVDAPVPGADLVTTIDSRIQTELFSLIKNVSADRTFTGGSGVIMDVTNGELITSTSFPEFNSEVLSEGKDAATIKSYLTDPRKFFLDRNTSGLYTPGSIVKPFLALGALNEGIIDPNTQILSTGSI